jgi:hypothetical protein
MLTPEQIKAIENAMAEDESEVERQEFGPNLMPRPSKPASPWIRIEDKKPEFPCLLLDAKNLVSSMIWESSSLIQSAMQGYDYWTPVPPPPGPEKSAAAAELAWESWTGGMTNSPFQAPKGIFLAGFSAGQKAK